MQSIYTSTQQVAIQHLRMLKLERNRAQDRLYVRLAYTYGLEIPTIAAESDMSLDAVRSLLVG